MSGALVPFAGGQPVNMTSDGDYPLRSVDTGQQQISDGAFTTQALGPQGGLGTYRLALLRQADPPAPPPGTAQNAWGGALLTAVRLAGKPANTQSGDLFSDSLVTVMQIDGYDDSAVVSFAGETGHEIDLQLQGTGLHLQNLTGNYVVPYAGAPAPGGTVSKYRGVWSTQWQGAVDAGGLTFTEAYGGYFQRPIPAGIAGLAVGTQWALYADPGQYFKTDDTLGKTGSLALEDRAGNRKYLRTSNSTLQVLDNGFVTVLMSLTNGGKLSAANGISPSGANGVASSTIFSGAGAPAAGLGGNGDVWIRQDGAAGSAVYYKAAGAWVAIA